MLVIEKESTAQHLSFAALVPALYAAFRDGASVPLRYTETVESEGARGTTLIMPAWNREGYYGVKIINIFPDNSKLGLPGLHATYNLYSARTGVPLALLDGDIITAYRTAAAAALGASYLARPQARKLLIVGSGRIASLIAQAMHSVRSIESVKVWSRQSAGAEKLARALCHEGFDARAVDDLEPAVRDSDIISCATLSHTPLILGEWLQPGTHLDLIGSFTPDMRETDSDCFNGTSVFVDTNEAIQKSGDLLGAIQDGKLAAADIRGTLEALCRGTVQGRKNDAEITVFKAVGSALEDLTAAQMVYEGLQTHTIQ